MSYIRFLCKERETLANTRNGQDTGGSYITLFWMMKESKTKVANAFCAKKKNWYLPLSEWLHHTKYKPNDFLNVRRYWLPYLLSFDDRNVKRLRYSLEYIKNGGYLPRHPNGNKFRVKLQALKGTLRSLSKKKPYWISVNRSSLRPRSSTLPFRRIYA